MNLRLSTLFFVIVVISTISLWYYRNTIGTQEKVMEIAAQTTSPDIVTPEEMNAFLPTWSKYAHDKISKNNFHQISLSDKAASQKLEKWLYKRGWEVDRFFYVEQRLAAIIKSIYLQKHSEDTIKILREQLKTETNPQIINNIENLIASQKQISNVEGVSAAEIAMVSPRLEEIEQILEGE